MEGLHFFFFFFCILHRDVDYDEKRLSLIRRIDFAWAVEKDSKKKQKKSSKESSTPWQWQSMVENLQLAHQELSVIIDLINTVSSAYNIYSQI
jgi:mediator of RNA polymerase II transcription subunit 17